MISGVRTQSPSKDIRHGVKMIAFKVDELVSVRSAGAIVRSVKALDHHAVVRVDLAQQLVEVEPTWSDADELEEALARAGFTPTAFVADAPDDASPPIDPNERP